MRQIPLLGAIRGLRSFYFGYIAFLIPLFLKQVGFSVVEIGIYALVATIASSGLVLLSGFMGDLYSKKKTLLIMSGLPAFIFVTFLLTHNFVLLFLTSVLGITFSAIGGGAGGGPVAPILTAFVADKVSSASRTWIYSALMLVSIISAIAGSSTSAVFEKYVSDYYTDLFAIALILNIASLFLTLLLEDTKIKRVKGKKTQIMPKNSGRNIAKIGLSGAMGSVGLGVITPIISLWFHQIGVPTYVISIIFTASYVASGVGVLFASTVERWLGAIYAIGIFRGLGSGLFILMPFVPPMVAGAIYAIRTGLYQLALPIRQNFQMTILDPGERARGNSLTGIARRLPYGVSTTFGSFLLSAGAIVFMFSFAGIVSLFDPILYVYFFRKYKKENVVETAT
ncbi:MAG: major facilitator superfamily MFS_1 [Thermoplasmatales archaeon A-plasma]|nr:MAG: major facilitator superfamily MFS_1 [Thermoplasmatales archaeon A-plasma]